jgi:phage shock protein PspC (stress-responsive transcriptional regulator)
MDQEKEVSVVRLFKVVFTVIAVISLVFVVYNIGVFTNDQDIEVFAENK